MECIFSARLGSPVAGEGKHVQETRRSGLVSPCCGSFQKFRGNVSASAGLVR